MGGGELGNVSQPELAAILHAGIWIVERLGEGASERTVARELDLTPGMVWKLEQLRKRLRLPAKVPRPAAWPPEPEPVVVLRSLMPELDIDLTGLF